MHDLHIRPARFSDIGALTQSLGDESFFVDRLDKQERGLGLLLTAWRGGQPIGVVYLWREPAEEWEIRTYLPTAPLLNHVEVHPDHRGTGVGTELVRTAEHVLFSRGHPWVALAVEVTNEGVADWYDSLGYREWGLAHVKCYSPSDGDGHRRVEICRVFVKVLPW